MAKKKEKQKETKKTILKKTKKQIPSQVHGRGLRQPESIVRVAKTTLDGAKTVKMSLTGIPGIAYNLSSAICRSLNINENQALNKLSPQDIEKIETIINSLSDKLPVWLLNRRKDYTTGSNTHKYGPDLIMQAREDVLRLRKIRAYRGIRHELGLPTRGQRTKNSFRKHGVVGVVKKKTIKK